MLDPQIIIGWAHLEKNIRDATEILLAHEHVPAITWLIPMSISCTGIFHQAHHLCNNFMYSKDWFSLYMGGLSYAIAVSISHCQEPIHEEMPHWFSFLHEQECSQIWLSGIRLSVVATFDSSVDQVGVFVQVCQSH